MWGGGFIYNVYDFSIFCCVINEYDVFCFFGIL